MTAAPIYHSSVLDVQDKPRLTASFWTGSAVAVVIHAGLALYLVNERFSVHVPEAQGESKPPIVTIERLKKPEPPKPAAKTTPPPKALAPRPVENVPPATETAPLTPVESPPADDGIKTPPVIAQQPGTAPATEPAPPAHVAVRWARFPDSDALLSYYPARAIDNEMEGSAELECTVMDARGRVACAVLSEQPKGYGFGKATVAMVQKEGRVDTSQGDVRIGSKLRTIVKWTLQ